MASSGSLFSETLQSITTTKLKELSKKRATYESQKAGVLAAVQLESDPQLRIRIIIDGVKSCFAIKTAVQKGRHREGHSGRIISDGTNNPALEVKLRNLERFLEQARYDPSLSSKLMQDWEQSLLQQLEVQSLRYQYATLYGELVTEWLSAEQPGFSADASSTNSDTEMLDDYRDIAAAKKLESRTEWENSVFEPSVTDEEAITRYLEDLFGNSGTNKEALKALKELRGSVETFEAAMTALGQFTLNTLKWTIAGLSASDLLTNEKRAVLKDFSSSDVILLEIADVLNMKMAAFDSWSWEGDVPIEQRRRLNGTFSVHMHEDLLQAIFLQYIGVKWSVFFKNAFRKFYKHEGAWSSLRKPVPLDIMTRRNHFLGSHSLSPSLQSKRELAYYSGYFMAQLLDSETQNIEIDDGDEEADTFVAGRKRKMIAQGAKMRRAVPLMQPEQRLRQLVPPYADYSTDVVKNNEEQHVVPPKSKNPMESKQALLHLLSMEITINTRLHNEITCIQSEYHSWMPSLPHSTIYAVLEFFGLSKTWTHFLKTFLEAPLKFVDDEDSKMSRVRKRGVPGSHILSEVLGEVILFCMDYSVNQKTEGSRLHRLHDGFWIWSPNHQACVKAWEAITTFADIMGVFIDKEKTATVRVVRDNDTGAPATIDPSLIAGTIRWGFLCLDPITGKFRIDQEIVDHHISDLRRQLRSKKGSVFSWVQAWNTYAATFFTTNFGTPANCYGREHVDQMLGTFERIQRELFSTEDASGNASNVVEYLKTTLQQRFSLTDIPDGYLFFPAELGGLGLQSPFVGLFQIRDSLIEDPLDVMDTYEDAESEFYIAAKNKFDKDKFTQREYLGQDATPEDLTFISFQEFIQYREEFSGEYEGELVDVFDKLLQKPSEESIEASSAVMSGLAALQSNGASQTNISNWTSMTPYWKWVTQLYGPEMMEKFGGLSIVDRGELPIGMVGLFRSGKVKWQD